MTNAHLEPVLGQRHLEPILGRRHLEPVLCRCHLEPVLCQCPRRIFQKLNTRFSHKQSEHASTTSFSGAAEGNGEARWGAENRATCPQGQCAKKLSCWARKPQPLGFPCPLDRRCSPLYQERSASSCITPEPGPLVSSEQRRKHTDVPQATALGQARAAPQHDAERTRGSAFVLFPGFT